MADLVRLFRDAGLDVIDDRVDPVRGDFTPTAVMLHHTAAGTNWPVNLHVLKHGHSRLSGPLCNVYIRREGIVHVVCDGRANDSGAGSSTVLAEVKAGQAVHRDARARGLTTSSVSGNRWFYDVEIDNKGTGESYPWPQVDATVAVAGVLLGHLGRDVGSLIYHRHWTARKIDPAHCPDFVALTDDALEDDMKVPQPDWLGDDVIDRLLAAGVLKSRPDVEPLMFWRVLALQDRTLSAVGGGGAHDHDGRYAAKRHPHGDVAPHSHEASVRLT